MNTLVEVANQDDGYAQYELGHYCFFSANDIDQSLYWLVLSEANGNPQATELLQEMINLWVPRIYGRIENVKANMYDNR